VLEWLNYVYTELHKGCGPLFNANIPQEMKDQIFIPSLKAKINFVENNLSEHTFLSGNKFSLADGYLFVILNWMPKFNVDLAQWPHVIKYFASLKNRESVRKSLQQEELLN